jgi:hypothetical protein
MGPFHTPSGRRIERLARRMSSLDEVVADRAA